MKTNQTEFWSGQFGAEYTDRNTPSTLKAWDDNYITNYGITRSEMFSQLLEGIDKNIKILEVGCNSGLQLAGLQAVGFKNLYGIELQSYAVEVSKTITKGINIIQGNAFDIPFKDNYFDLVMTNGVLIHISPTDLPKAFKEIERCSKQYIMGFEYFAEEITDVKYRGNEGFLWKADYAQMYQEQFKNLTLLKNIKYPYLTEQEKGNIDNLFLLEKK